MSFLENNIPDFLADKRNTRRQIAFTVIFALVFINLYSPFGVEKWYDVNRTQMVLYTSAVVLAGLIIIAISRIILHQFSRKKRISNGNYIAWIAAEIISLAIGYLVLQRVFITSSGDIFSDFKDALKVTALVLLLPYTISYLYFSWLEKNRKLEELTKSTSFGKQVLPSMIPFRDEKGELKFSVKSEDLLYLEAADNYVIIHYLDHSKPAKYMIRNTLKNFEQEMEKRNVIRCHRSYMVHFDRVSIVRKEKDGLVLELDMPGEVSLPISKTYTERVMRVFSEI